LALLEELKDTKKYFADDKDFKLLFAKLEELKGTQHPHLNLCLTFCGLVSVILPCRHFKP
jgi:hypothetical protein